MRHLVPQLVRGRCAAGRTLFLQTESSLSESIIPTPATVIKIIGVGGAGGNAVNHMASSGLSTFEFICANTDAQALSNTRTEQRIQLGESGLGAGSDPMVGRESATRERNHIAEALKGADMVFITAGMGGGTGTGAAPVVAEVARELGILTVAVVSKPFEFEGPRRMRVAEEGIAALARCVDSLIIVLNSRLEEVLGEDVTQKQAFAAADEVLSKAVTGIADIIAVPGMINVDFEDVRTVMRQTGMAMMGTAQHAGDDRAARAAEEAIACPLLDGANLRAARGVLVNIAASEETLMLRETKLVMNTICAQTNEDAIIKFGAVFDDTLGDAMRVTVVATGLNRPSDLAPGTRRPSIARPGTQPHSVLRQNAVHAPVRLASAQQTGSMSRQSAERTDEDTR
ncbi:cell division protein FtsZ [Massilia litorea]|uniref:Cell division protein FtsZ n=1 Tax=Massilia litorea TaxID=2769491 RepID=A0A7L9U0C1_9BURK|nr:cell division protein FtsZ [Massilia litorea]